MNDSDSQRLLGFLKNINYIRTDRPEKADLIILNTCSVRDKAEQKVYSALGRFKELKSVNPGLVIAVAGCVAQQAGEALLKRVPYLDMVIGTHNIHRIHELLANVSGKRKRVAETGFFADMDKNEYSVAAVPEGGRALLSIMRGCDNFCSYCIVPYTRGREASRPPEEILAEINGLVSKGVVEVTLVGQNVNSYGLGTLTPFPALLRQVSAVSGLKRIRFVTSHPKDIQPELIELFKEEEKLCSHMHLPVQSGSDEVLRRMRRGYTRSDYLEKINRLRRARPGMAITSDVIVGFPGETERDFSETLKLIDEARFDNIFSFMYSPRPGTGAAALDGHLPQEVKSERLAMLQKRQREIAFDKNRELIGRTMEVIIEGRSRQSAAQYVGRSSCARVVNITLPVDMTGKLVDVEITGAYHNSLRGELNERKAICC